MSNYRDEIEQFIYEICYQPIWAPVSEYVSQHVSLLDLTYSRIKNPDKIYGVSRAVHVDADDRKQDIKR